MELLATRALPSKKRVPFDIVSTIISSAFCLKLNLKYSPFEIVVMSISSIYYIYIQYTVLQYTPRPFM